LDKKEFEKMIRAIQKTVPFNISNELIDHLFKRFDLKSNGKIDLPSITTILSKEYGV
jgi:Ca2+-binding EF-hand superfamily protein